MKVSKKRRYADADAEVQPEVWKMSRHPSYYGYNGWSNGKKRVEDGLT